MFKSIPFLFIFLNLLILEDVEASSVRVVNRVNNSTDEIKTLDNLRGVYVSVKDVSRILSVKKPYINTDRLKMVLYLGNNRLKISGNSSYILVDERVYQIPSFAIWDNNDIYVQAEALFNLIRETTMPGIGYDSRRMVLDIDIKEFNITGIEINEKSNGTVLRLKTRSSFPEGNISSFFHENGWFYITIADALVDTTEIRRSDSRGVVRNITADQLKNTAQIAFQIKTKVESHELYQAKDPSEIVVSLRTPMDNSSARIKEVKNRWKLDTIVLDAGHGGKDPGTMGPRGTKEKDIALDITKRVGLLLEKNTKLKVIYTREEDIFIPLWKRTQIANESGGKLFMSIHVNASTNRKIKGFETFLHSWDKTGTAIDVAARENAVIKFEEKKVNYEKLSMERKITATMASSMFLKESEVLAAGIQEELDKLLTVPNRGVKQAGFYVLSGASMPCVLFEGGFISNPSEEKNLKSPSYRKKIAQGVYKAIIKFKSSREKVLAQE